MKKSIVTIAITAALVSGAASAATGADSTAPYVGVGVLSSTYRFDNLPKDTSRGDRTHSEAGYKVFVGTQVGPGWGVEAGYVNFGKSSYDYVVESGRGHVDAKFKSLYVAGKQTWHLNQQFALSGKLGIAHNEKNVSATGLAKEVTSSENHNNLFASLGLEYAISPTAALAVELENYGRFGHDRASKRASGLNANVRVNF